MSRPRAAPGRWPRDEFAAAVWSSDLKPLQRLVALAYADHARDADTAWLSYERLMDRTGMGRTAIAAALRALIEGQWLQVVEPARQHRSARYRLVPQQSRSGTSQESQSRTPGDLQPSDDWTVEDSQQFASRTGGGRQQSSTRTPEVPSSSPRDASSSPRDASSSPRGPDCSSDLNTNNNNLAREEVKVLVNPEDHEPRSEENLADRLRGAGVSWSDLEIKEAVRRLAAAYGGDMIAEGAAAGVLMQLATRRPKPVERIGAYLATLNDDQLRALRPSTTPRRRREPAAAIGCDDCRPGPTPIGFVGEDSEGRYRPCPTCRPHLVKKAG